MKYEIGQEVHNKNFHAKILGIKRTKNKHPQYEYMCINCNQENCMDIYSAEKGFGCPVCANRKCVKGINDILTTNPWMVPYFVDINDTYTHTANMNNKCNVKCPYCGRIRASPLSPNQIYSKNGFSCICKDGISIPNKLAYTVMEQLEEQAQIQTLERVYKRYYYII